MWTQPEGFSTLILQSVCVVSPQLILCSFTRVHISAVCKAPLFPFYLCDQQGCDAGFSSSVSFQERRSPNSRRLKSFLPGRREKSHQVAEQRRALKPASPSTMSAKPRRATLSLDRRRTKDRGEGLSQSLTV